MIAILPIQPDVLQLIAEETELAAEGPVWGYLAADGKTMLGYVIVEKAEPVRVIALQCEDFAIADGLLRRALHPFYEEGSRGYTFACEVPLPLPMAYTRRGVGSLAVLFEGKCPAAKRNVIITEYRLIVCKEV